MLLFTTGTLYTIRDDKVKVLVMSMTFHQKWHQKSLTSSQIDINIVIKDSYSIHNSAWHFRSIPTFHLNYLIKLKILKWNVMEYTRLEKKRELCQIPGVFSFPLLPCPALLAMDPYWDSPCFLSTNIMISFSWALVIVAK